MSSQSEEKDRNSLELLGILYGDSRITKKPVLQKEKGNASQVKIELKELAPIPVDYGLRVSSFLFSKSNASDVGGLSYGGNDLAIVKSNFLGSFAFEREADALARGLDEVLPVVHEPRSLKERTIDYIGSDIAGPHVLIPIASKITQGDSAVLNGLSGHSSRAGHHLETKYLSNEQAIALIKGGYPLYTAAIPEDAALLFMDYRRTPILERAKLRKESFRVGQTVVEPIMVGSQPILWDDKSVLENDNLLSWLAYAFTQLKDQTRKTAINLPIQGAPRERTQIAQAVAHMLGRPIRWHTEPVHMKYYYRKELGFDANVHNQESMDQDRFRIHRDRMRSIFSLPWPEAHKEWIVQKESLN